LIAGVGGKSIKKKCKKKIRNKKQGGLTGKRLRLDGKKGGKK